VKCKVKP